LFSAVRAWCNARVVQAAVVPEVPAGRSRRPRWWLWSALIAVVLTCLTTASVVAVRHYRYAPALRCAWAGATPGSVSNSHADGHSQMTVAATGARQAFLVDIVNDSSVTQTILGLADPGGPSVYRPTLQAGLEAPTQGMTQAHYASGPLAVPPHGRAALRFSFRSVCVAEGGTVYWDALKLRVRVGAFTRTESVSFGGTAMAVRGTRASTACH
jgi:hypothetical protein